MKKILFIALASVSNISFASSVSGVDNAAYYQTLTGIFFNVLLLIGLLAALGGLLWLMIVTLRTVLNPSLIQQTGGQPITIGRLLGGLVVVSILWQPLDSMSIFNDLTGVGKDGLCLAVDVTVAHIDWENKAASCIENAEKRFSDLAEYTNEDHIKSANIGLLFSVIQLVSLGFFLSSAWMAILHFIGVREVKMKLGTCIISATISTVVMASPSLVDYVEDIRGQENVVLDTSG